MEILKVSLLICHCLRVALRKRTLFPPFPHGRVPGDFFCHIARMAFPFDPTPDFLAHKHVLLLDFPPLPLFFSSASLPVAIAFSLFQFFFFLCPFARRFHTFSSFFFFR